MVDSTLNTHKTAARIGGPTPYDKRKLSYAHTFDNPWQSGTIRTLEWLTGKLTLLNKIRRFEREGVPVGHAFWGQALNHMGIELQIPDEQIARIPSEGPLVVVANHPHGLVDGVVMAELIGRVRTDYRILTRNLLTGVSEISQFLIPVPFQHEDSALEKNLEMRRHAMDHLGQGGVIALFPSGVIATSGSMFGPVVEAEWNPFTAKLIQRSGARVVPIYFPGQNSRAYHIANQMSATIRQGLLLHEVVHAFNRPQRPIVGEPIERDEIERWAGNPRGFMAALRESTLALGGGAR